MSNENIPSSQQSEKHVPVDGEIHMSACLLRTDMRLHIPKSKTENKENQPKATNIHKHQQSHASRSFSI